MSESSPGEVVTQLRRTLRRSAMVGWILGGLLVVGGLVVAASPSLWLGSERTEGTVARLEPDVELISHGGSPHAGEMVWYEQVTVWYPVVEYQVGDRKYTCRPRSTFRVYKVGQKVPILYEADRPGAARIDTFAERWLAPLLVGIVLSGLGVVVLAGTARFRMMARRLEDSMSAESRHVANRAGTDPTAPTPS